MLENLLITIIRQRFLVLASFALCILGGLLAFKQIPIDAFPDLTNVQVQILTEAPGMPPNEVEQLVTIPIESLLSGIPRVTQTRSISKYGLSVITVVFPDDANIYFARQLLFERLKSASTRLPDHIEPELGPITTGMGEIYQYVLSGPNYSPTELKTFHDWEIKYALRTVPGISEVNTWGGFTQEYQVILSPEKLLQYQLTLNDILTALQQNNANFSGGSIEHGPEQYLIRGQGRFQHLDDIANTLIKKQGSEPIPIGQVGEVRIGQAARQGAVTQDGHGEVVTGLVMMLKGENSREVIQRIKQKINVLRQQLPPGLSITPFYDQTRLVDQTLHTVQKNLLEGGGLVILVLLLMLGNLRAALIVAAVIPISMMFSLMGMKALGISANIMSLGAIDFGMIVDGSIVMVENTIRKLTLSQQQNPATVQDPQPVIEESLREMARPILFGILIIALVYLPILSLQGMEYKLFSPMVFTLCLALFGSLLCALLLVPVLCRMALKGKACQEHENWLIRTIQSPYQAFLRQALQHRKWTIGLTVVVFLLTLATVPFLGTEFIPQLDEGAILIEVKQLPSASLSQSVRTSTLIEKTIAHIPEIQTVVSKSGRPDLATDPMGIYQTDVYVMLKPKEQWRPGIRKTDLVNLLSQRLQQNVPGVLFNFTQPIAMRVNELVSGVRSDVAIKLFGDNLTVLAQKAQEIEQVIHGIPGQRDVQVEKLIGSPQWVITPDRIKMARYGVTINEIRMLVEAAFRGTPATEILEGKKRFTLRVQLPQSSELSLPALQNLLIETSENEHIPLAQIAQVQRMDGLEVINREAGQRRILIQANVQGRDLGSFVKEAQQKIERQITLPSGYFLQWGGQFENQQRAMHKLLLVVPLSILTIFLLLMATFSSVRQSLLVLINVPFALIGGIVALWVCHLYLNVPAVIGFIALFGVAVLNGLVLVSSINQLIRQGVPLLQAVQEGAQTRLRPVLMTALVATLGFLPMTLSTGSGAEVQKPLATVVIGGLITSTLLTLIVLPVVYAWMMPKTEPRR